MQKKHANFRINLQSCDVERMKIDRKISKAFFLVIIFCFVLSIHHMIADSMLIIIIIIISFVIHQSSFIFGSFSRSICECCHC